MFDYEPQTLISSPCLSSNLVPPSSATQAEFLLSIGFFIVIFIEIGTIKGLKLNECAANGVIQMH
jgi:hypothetical protein